MEIDSGAGEQKSNQFRWNSEEHVIRFYRCTFCKKGFSNAQALGGHMNIHRRDRAKLKEFSDEDDNNLLSLDIKISDGDDQFLSLPAEYSGGDEEVLGSLPKRRCVTHDDRETNDHNNQNHCKDKGKSTLSDGAATVLPELDLELRLGFNLNQVGHK